MTRVAATAHGVVIVISGHRSEKIAGSHGCIAWPVSRCNACVTAYTISGLPWCPAVIAPAPIECVYVSGIRECISAGTRNWPWLSVQSRHLVACSIPMTNFG